MASINFCESFTIDATINSALSKNLIVNSDSTFRITGNLNTNFTESTIYLPTSDKILVGSTTLATNINNGSVPQGVIMMWSGTVIPNGWALCNGQTANGMVTPNLSGRFVIGVGTTEYPFNDRNGNKSYIMTTANIPKHTHTFPNKSSPSGSHTHSLSFANNRSDSGGKLSQGNTENTATTLSFAGNWDHNHTYTTNYDDGSTTERTVLPISLLPRYYVLSYIMKL